MTVLETAALAPHLTVLPAGDLIDIAGQQTDAVRGLLRAFSAVAGILFVIVNWIKSGGALGRVIVCGIAAGAFVWIVWNVSDLRDKVGSEFDAQGPAPAVVVDVPRGV